MTQNRWNVCHEENQRGVWFNTFDEAKDYAAELVKKGNANRAWIGSCGASYGWVDSEGYHVEW